MGKGNRENEKESENTHFSQWKRMASCLLESYDEKEGVINQQILRMG